MIKYCYKLLVLLLLLTTSCGDDDNDYTEINVPTAPEIVYVIDNAKFGILSNNTDPQQTTQGINNAIEWAKAEGYNVVKFTKGDYAIHCIDETGLYATNGIFALTNMTLDFGDAQLHVAPNNSKAYALINVDHVENATIRGGHLIGDRNTHTQEHFQGVGIQVIASRNIKIDNVKIEGMTGDGIVLTIYTYMSFHGRFYSKNVQITGCDISDCGRQGIEAVQVKGLEISNNKFYNLPGSSQYGIDINPNPAWKSVVEQINIHHNNIEDCGGGMRLWGGSDMDIYENHLIKLGIYAIESRRVHIHNNTLTDLGGIYISEKSEDFCVPTSGNKQNTCNKVTDLSKKTGNFVCK